MLCTPFLAMILKETRRILGLWLNQTESKNRWMQVFDELKVRVEDVFSFRWTVFPVSKKAQKQFFLLSLCSAVLFILFEMRYDTSQVRI